MLTEENFVDFKCPHCGEGISFPQNYAGLAQECPLCSEAVIVPKDGSDVGRKIPLPLSTARLVLRRLRGLDWKDLMELMADEELFRYQEGQALGEEQITHWLESDAHVRLTTPDQPFCLGLELQGKDKLIGYLALSLSDPQRPQATIHIVLNRAYQRQGLATEAVRAVLAFCFEAIGLHRVTAHCDSRDAAGCRLFEKAGLRREGEFVKNRFMNGEWVSTVWYAMLDEDYQKTRRQPSA